MAVPLLVRGRVRQAQVAREVDDHRLRLRLPEPGGVGRGDAVGQREQVRAGLLGQARLVREVPFAGAGGEGHLCARVRGEQAHGLAPRVARRSENPDLEAHK